MLGWVLKGASQWARRTKETQAFMRLRSRCPGGTTTTTTTTTTCSSRYHTLCPPVAVALHLQRASEFRTAAGRYGYGAIETCTSRRLYSTADTSSDDNIIEVSTMEDFQSLAGASKAKPIILDFYADWCGPCKQLSPKLVALSKSSKGAFQIAKLDVEKQALAPLVQHLKISSLPTLMVIFQGQIVANSIIIGVPDDSKLAGYVEMIKGLGAGEAEDKKDTKEMMSQYFEKLKAKDTDVIEEASQFFGGVLSDADSEAEDKVRAKVGLAQAALLEDKVDIAKELVKAAEQDCEEGKIEKIAELESMRAQLEFWDGKENLIEIQALLETDPNNLEVLHRYASALFAEGKVEDAMEAALGIVGKDKSWNEEAGRKLLVKFFEALGANHELVAVYRKKLSNIWYI